MDAAPPPGIDPEHLLPWLSANVPGLAAGGPPRFELIGDGRSNLTYSVTNATGRWVLRRPPLGHRVATAHDMAREFRVISGVSTTGFPTARPIALCTDEAVNGLPFYVMDYVDGQILVDGLPDGFATPAQRAALSVSFATALARLHAVDYEAVGLGGFGRPEGYLQRQVKRWSQQWEANQTRDLPEIDEMRRRLERAMPARSGSAIVHGDYRLGNIVLDRDDPARILAVLDWEMSTLGDPLADVGYTLAYWRGPGDNRPRPGSLREYAKVTAHEGFFARDELIGEYERQSGRDVSSIDFYEFFAYYKLAVITEGIHKRNVEGQQLGTGLEIYANASVELSAFGLDLADHSEDTRLHGD